MHEWLEPDYPDPYDFINVLLDGGTSRTANNNNFAYFNNPAYNKRDGGGAAKLSVPGRLERCTGNLDSDITKHARRGLRTTNRHDACFFSSRRRRCLIYQPVNEARTSTPSALK